MKNFWIRTASAAVYAALMISVICFNDLFSLFSDNIEFGSLLGGWVKFLFFLFVMVVGLFEFYRMAEAKGLKPFKALGYIAGVILYSFGMVLLWIDTSFSLYFLVCFILLLVLPIVSVIAALTRKEGNPFADLGVTILSVLYISLPLMLFLLFCSSKNVGARVIMMVVVLIWVNDAFAYMGGSLIGKHKLWPRHSPGKTWEGCAVGFLFSILTAVFVGPLMTDHLAWPAWLAIAALCSVMGTLGDLAESMFKRSCGVKDSGSIMPGHGGILDRFDSILAVTPFLMILFLFVNQ